MTGSAGLLPGTAGHAEDDNHSAHGQRHCSAASLAQRLCTPRAASRSGGCPTFQLLPAHPCGLWLPAAPPPKKEPHFSSTFNKAPHQRFYTSYFSPFNVNLYKQKPMQKMERDLMRGSDGQVGFGTQVGLPPHSTPHVGGQRPSH